MIVADAGSLRGGPSRDDSGEMVVAQPSAGA